MSVTNAAIERLAQKPMLSAKRTAILLERAKAGDKAAEDRIIRHSARLLKHAVDSLQYPDELLDDLFQEGQIALRNAIRSYQPDLGATWTSWAYNCARRKMVNALNKRSNTPPEIASMSVVIASLREDTTGSQAAELFKVCDQLYIREHLPILTSREKEVVCSYYCLGVDHKQFPEIASELGISKQRVEQIRTQALEKLYESMTRAEHTTPVGAA